MPDNLSPRSELIPVNRLTRKGSALFLQKYKAISPSDRRASIAGLLASDRETGQFCISPHTKFGLRSQRRWSPFIRYATLTPEAGMPHKVGLTPERGYATLSGSLVYEEIGLFPRSFSRVFDRFFKQLFSDVENLVLQEYRFYRYLFLTTVKCAALLLFAPFLVNILAKNYLVRPLTEYFWNTKQTEIFLNAYQQKHAFAELHDFQEGLYFQSLVLPISAPVPIVVGSLHDTSKEGDSIVKEGSRSPVLLTAIEGQKAFFDDREAALPKMTLASGIPPSKIARSVDFLTSGQLNSSGGRKSVPQSPQEGLSVEIEAHEKTIELAIDYNNQSVEAITNFFADLISFIVLCYLLVAMQIQINITKSFLFEVFFGLDDSKKSLLILLVTDLLVGYHSDGPWAILFESVFNHYGLPASPTSVFLLVATLPVLLDVLFKYLIFRHLNRASPATVATYHAMIE